MQAYNKQYKIHTPMLKKHLSNHKKLDFHEILTNYAINILPLQSKIIKRNTGFSLQ